MRLRSTSIALAALAAVAFTPSASRASDIVDGRLVFASDALATYGFESLGDLVAVGAGKVQWTTNNGYDQLVDAPLFAGTDDGILLADALEGGHGLRVGAGASIGLAIRDDAVFTANLARKISVSMWGRSLGAEPVLELVYAHSTTSLGPDLIHVVAARTGRETEDGWVEYSTGPVDASALGAADGTPLRAIVLTARYATTDGLSQLTDYAFGPSDSSPPVLGAPDGYAVIDALEIRPEHGSVSGPAACTIATVDSACDAAQDCLFGHCIDAALVWGPVPQSKTHRSDLAARWAFVATSLQADRQSIAIAETSFHDAAKTLAAETSPRGFYGGLNRLVSGLHDSHTTLGYPAADDSVLSPYAYTQSGPMDVCFGLAEDDLGAGGAVFSVFDVGTNSILNETFQKGDVVTAIDGVAPSAWLALVAPRMGSQTPDPEAAPSSQAFHLADLVGRYATTVSLARCQSGGGCAALPDVHVADQVFSHVQSNGGTGGYSIRCSLRFHPSVSDPPPDGVTPNQVVVETVDGVTSVQFDGFEGDYGSNSNPYAAWKTPMSAALSGGGNVLMDARIGWGGRFTLGKFLFQLGRGTDQPYGMFAVPRGAFDEPDPPWLLSSIFDACPSPPTNQAPDICHWMGGNTAFTANASPPGEAAKIAWLNGNDVSMNDIVPRLFQGRANFRVFGPHPTHGSYGEIAFVAPIQPSWGTGSIQVLDMRFGTSPADARTHGWESGHGVVPDQVVLQKVSDILLDQDTVLATAKAWLAQ